MGAPKLTLCPTFLGPLPKSLKFCAPPSGLAIGFSPWSCSTCVDEPNPRSQNPCCLSCPNAVNQSVPSCVLTYDSSFPWGHTILLPSFKFLQRSQSGNQEVIRASDSQGTERGVDGVPLAMVEKNNQQKARAAVSETWRPC